MYNLRDFYSLRTKMHLLRDLWHATHVWSLFHFGLSSFNLIFFIKKSKLFGLKLELNHWKKRFDDQIKKKTQNFEQLIHSHV